MDKRAAGIVLSMDDVALKMLWDAHAYVIGEEIDSWDESADEAPKPKRKIVLGKNYVPTKKDLLRWSEYRERHRVAKQGK